MDRDAAVTQLPLMYQRVVALLDEGRTSGEIAACLGIDPIAIPALIELAMAKLERARDDAPGPTSGSCNVPD